MLHSVGCPQPKASVFAKLWNSDTVSVAVHAVLQADGTVYQCLPWNFRGWHCGGAGNNTHVGVEMTEPSQIKYGSGNSFTCSDTASAKEQAKGTYETAVKLFAYLCNKYKLDPLGDGVILSHREGCNRGIASNHGDPEHLWKGLNLPYTMDGFRLDVKNEMQKGDDEVRYEKLKDVKNSTYRQTLDKLVKNGFLQGKSGSGEEMVLDLTEDSVRLLVILDRAGVFG